MHINKNDVDVRLEIPGAVIRQRKGFGSVSGYGAISGEYFTLSAGVDTTPLFQGLKGNQCQCPHWGFVLKGRITTTDAAGKRETVNADDLFYWPEGHPAQAGKPMAGRRRRRPRCLLTRCNNFDFDSS